MQTKVLLLLFLGVLTMHAEQQPPCDPGNSWQSIYQFPETLEQQEAGAFWKVDYSALAESQRIRPDYVEVLNQVPTAKEAIGKDVSEFVIYWNRCTHHSFVEFVEYQPTVPQLPAHMEGAIVKAVEVALTTEETQEQPTTIVQEAPPPPTKRQSLISGLQNMGQGATGFLFGPIIGIAGVAGPAISTIANLVMPGNDPTVRTLSAKGVSPGPSNSVKLNEDWYKNPDW